MYRDPARAGALRLSRLVRRQTNKGRWCCFQRQRPQPPATYRYCVLPSGLGRKLRCPRRSPGSRM